MKNLLHPREAADLLGVSTRTLINWEKSEKLTSVRAGESSKRRYRIADIQKILSGGSMNRFYEVYIVLNNKADKKNVGLFLGDKKFDAEVGRFEVLFVVDNEHQISKMECNFLLRVPHFSVSHPELLYVNLPVDLLHQVEPYEYRMSLTSSSNIDEIGGFAKMFGEEWQGTKSYSMDQLGAAIEDTRESLNISAQKKHLARDEGVYETIDLPPIAKFRCRKFKHFPGTESFGLDGWMFQFSTTVPKILGQITYNTLSDCVVDKLHTGSGDNK